jgi:hypothetical protein
MWEGFMPFDRDGMNDGYVVASRVPVVILAHLRCRNPLCEIAGGIDWRHCLQLLVMKETRILPGTLFVLLLASLSLTGCGSTSQASIAAPTFSPAAGTYPSAQMVTLSDATPGASIYYTTNGTAPAGAFLGTLYTGPFPVGVAETVNAIATYSNLPFSPVSSAAYVVGVGAPTFSVAAGTYTTIQAVTISDTTPGASIYYTLNGTTPTTASTLYTGPVNVGVSETINAIATLAGTGTSTVGSVSYTINLPTAPAPTISPAAGTYTTIQSVTLADSVSGASIYYTLNGTTPTNTSSFYSGPISVGVSETVTAIAAATGYNNSGVSASAYIINLPPAPTPTFSPVAGTYTTIQNIAIADAASGASIYYTLNGTTPTTASTPYTGPITVGASESIQAIATAAGYITSLVGSAAYTINLPPAPTPTFSPVAGTYTASQTVAIADSASGASIYYTLNGSTPTTASTPYTGPIVVNGTETVKAIATATGYVASAVGEATFTINLPPAATPTFSPAAGSYSTAQTVTIADATAGSAIYYTLDGSTPTTSSAVYTAPITVSGSETINAIAFASGFSVSPVATAQYTILSYLTGKVMAGNQVVTGSTVQLYVAGAGGYGVGSSSIATAVTTDATGSFTLTFVCPSSTGQIYVLADGGNPGLTAGTNNPYLALMAAVGPCGAVAAPNASATVTVNEVTTVSAVYALQQFMASPTLNTTQGIPMIGTSTATYGGVQTGIIGLQNAFGMVNNMVSVVTGSAGAPTNSWATPETTKINTIADMLYTCDSVNPTTSTACTTLMTDATPSTKTKAIDVIQAAWYMAQNPGNNVANLYKLVPITGTWPYAEVATAPNDLTIAVNLAPTYTGTSYACGTATCTSYYGVATPHHVAIDRFGNVWLSNNGTHASLQIATPTGTDFPGPASSVVELAPNGSVLMNPVTTFTASTSGGSYSQFTTKPSTTVTFSTPKMVAIDTSNNVWIANYGSALGTPAAGSIGYFNGSTAAKVAGSVSGGYFVGGAPWGIAIDGHNNVYESNTTATGLDALSIGKFAAGTGTYTYSTSGGAAPPNQIPNTSAITALGAGNSSAVLAVDSNTAASGGADGFLWLASSACVTQGQYDSAANIGWGIVDIFDADTLGPVSGAEATTSFSNAITGPGSVTSCGSSTGANALSGAGLIINQIFTAAMSYPFGVAIDKNNGVWIADAGYASNPPNSLQGFNGLTYLAAPTTGTGVIPTSAYIVNGSALTPAQTLSQGQVQREPTYIEVDGNNNVWGVSQGFGTVAEATYNATTNTITYLTPASGEGFAHTLATAYGMAIDSSGNVWITNTSTNGASYYVSSQGPEVAVGFSMTVIVGAAGPVVTPLSQAVQSNMLGQKP